MSDCAGDIDGDILPTWPFTSDTCHSTTVEPLSTTDAGTNCCNIAYDNCDGTPKFVDVTKTFDTTTPVTGDETGMGCSVDTDGDGVDDGRDRCPYSTSVEVDYINNLDPDGNPVDASGLITKDSFVVSLNLFAI